MLEGFEVLLTVDQLLAVAVGCGGHERADVADLVLELAELPVLAVGDYLWLFALVLDQEFLRLAVVVGVLLS